MKYGIIVKEHNNLKHIYLLRSIIHLVAAPSDCFQRNPYNIYIEAEMPCSNLLHHKSQMTSQHHFRLFPSECIRKKFRELVHQDDRCANMVVFKSLAKQAKHWHLQIDGKEKINIIRVLCGQTFEHNHVSASVIYVILCVQD